MQPLTHYPLCIKLLYNILYYIYHTFITLLPSYTVSFSLASHNCLNQYYISFILMQALTYHLLFTNLLHNIFQYILHTFICLFASYTVFFHLAPHNYLQHYHISYFFMQALTNNLSSTILLHNLFKYIFYTFASLHLSHTVSFSLAFNNYLKHISKSCFLMQALISYLRSLKLLHNLFEYIFYTFPSLFFSHTVSFYLASHSCLA